MEMVTKNQRTGLRAASTAAVSFVVMFAGMSVLATDSSLPQRGFVSLVVAGTIWLYSRRRPSAHK